MTDDEVDTLLAKSLREGSLSLPQPISDAVIERIVARAVYHGVVSLLHARIAVGGRAPKRLYDALHSHALGVAMHEFGERRELARVIEAFVTSGAWPLLIKGAALAHSLYTDPATRERADADLLVDATQVEAAHQILIDLGWRHQPSIEVDLAIGQKSYTFAGAGGSTYLIDLHWQIGNSQVLAALFKDDEIWKRSVPLSALHPKARAPCPADALIIACMHRLIHLRTPYYSGGAARYSADRLIWLYDILLLSASLSPEAWEDFVARAVEKGLAGACLDGLTSAQAHLGATVPDSVVEELAVVGEKREIATTYLHATWFQRERMDFRAMKSLSTKFRFLVQVVFPPADYMRARHRGVGVNWLPWLYFTRAIDGIWKRMRGRPDALDRKVE